MTIDENERARMGRIMGGAIGASLGSVLIQLANGQLETTLMAGAGALITSALERVGQDFNHRALSSRESIRLGQAVVFAVKKQIENERNGLQLRSDNFFTAQMNDRPLAEEIVEAVMSSIQREFEERKIPFLSYLVINIAYRHDIDRHHAHLLIKIAEELTYRQYCLLSIIANRQDKQLRFDRRSIDSGCSAWVSSLMKMWFAGALDDTGIGAFGGGSPGGNWDVSDEGLLLNELMELIRIPQTHLEEPWRAIAQLTLPPR